MSEWCVPPPVRLFRFIFRVSEPFDIGCTAKLCLQPKITKHQTAKKTNLEVENVRQTVSLHLRVEVAQTTGNTSAAAAAAVATATTTRFPSPPRPSTASVHGSRRRTSIYAFSFA